MKADKFILGTVLLAVVLLACVPLCSFVVSFIFSANGESNDSSEQIIAGITSETIRACITIFLYDGTTGKGTRVGHGIKYGLLYSALIGSLYLILGAFYFHVSSPMRFLITDTMILAVQGITTGMVLYFLFRDSKQE
jgi:hypothetical protein